MSYPATPEPPVLSVEAVHEIVAVVDVVVPASRPVGTDGAVVSGVVVVPSNSRA